MKHQPTTPTITCGGCQCWCDDIHANTETQKWKNACELGKKWLNDQVQSGAAASLADQREQRSTIEQLAEQLVKAQQPAIFGLVDCDIDAQRQAVAIADRVRGIIDPALSAASRAKTLSLQQTGEISATWGEVKNRASVIVYWNCDRDSAPRFAERYGDQAESCFDSPQRTVFAVGSERTLKSWPDHAIKIRCRTQDLAEELLHGAFQSAETTSEAKQILDALRSASYAAFVVGPAATLENEDDNNITSTDHQMAYETLTQFIATQNQERRTVMVPWGGGQGKGNGAGIQSVLTWRTGYPMAVSFADGSPQYQTPENYWENVLEQNATDFVLWLGSIPPAAIQRLRQWKACPTNQLIQIASAQNGSADIRIVDSFINSRSLPASTEPLGRCVVQRPDSVMVPCPWPPNNTANILQQLYSVITDRTAAK